MISKELYDKVSVWLADKDKLFNQDCVNTEDFITIHGDAIVIMTEIYKQYQKENRYV
tara:strand:+ start:41 stop:211 length:171 start_codon:yes stop_codon:yes gene_type:complete